MLYTKALHLLVSEKKNFEDGLVCSYVPTCDPGVGPVLTPGASYAHQKMLHIKYQSSSPYGLGQEDF